MTLKHGTPLAPGLLFVAGLLVGGCETLEIEGYDGAYGYHDWGTWGLDFEYADPLQQHAVLLTGRGGLAPAVACSWGEIVS